MSGKQLIRLALAFGVLLLVWAAAALARRREAAPADAFRLPPIARSTADTVMLERSSDTIVLARKDTSTWTVNGYPAGRPAVTDLLAALADSAPKSELVAERRASHAAFGVGGDSGTRVRVRGGGRTLADLIVGRRSMDFSGGYVRRADQEPTYLVRGRLVELLSRSRDEWRDHRIATVPADSVAAIEISRGTRRYALRRAGKGWTSSLGGPVDSARVADLLAAYRPVDASGFASAAQADSARFASPDRRTRLLRSNRTPLLTLLFDSTAAGFWVRADTGKTIYRIDSYTADRLAPVDSGFRVRARASSGR
jgi:hypothetical protein